MPAIIDRSTWEEAQRMRTKTARHVEQGAVDFLLTGRAFCGHCGAAMIGDSGTSKSDSLTVFMLRMICLKWESRFATIS